MEELKSLYLRKDNNFFSITYFEDCVRWKLFLTVFNHILLAFIFNVSSLTLLVFTSHQMADAETLKYSMSVCRQAFGAIQSCGADQASVKPSKKFRILLSQRFISLKVKFDTKSSTWLYILYHVPSVGSWDALPFGSLQLWLQMTVTAQQAPGLSEAGNHVEALDTPLFGPKPKGSKVLQLA